ncbi:MAG: response regulator [Chloroflexota bacterium]
MSARTSILIVDDNPSMAKTTADILALEGYTVHTATSGAEALQVIQREKVHILLTDVIMPGMNGVDLFVQARQHIPNNLIAFLMTAYSADDLIQRGRQEGAKAVLAKPLDLNLLLTLVKAVEDNYLKRER